MTKENVYEIIDMLINENYKYNLCAGVVKTEIRRRFSSIRLDFEKNNHFLCGVEFNDKETKEIEKRYKLKGDKHWHFIYKRDGEFIYSESQCFGKDGFYLLKQVMQKIEEFCKSKNLNLYY